MRILLAVILAITTICLNTLFAANCMLKGEWIMTVIPAKSSPGGIVFEQEGNRVWVAPTPYPGCGELKTEGTTDGTTFVLKSYTTNPEPKKCQFLHQTIGTFSPDCYSAQGKIILTPESVPPEMPFKMYRNLIKITKPDTANELVISAEPKMPDITVKAIHMKPDPIAYLSSQGTLDTRAPAYTWHVSISHNTVPPRIIHHTKLSDVTTNTPSYHPNFDELINVDNNEKVEGSIMGGELTLGVEFYNAAKDERKYSIKGTNPGQAAIERMLTTPMSRQIACQESKYKQFKGNREGGIGNPVIGKNNNNEEIGGIGIMQIFKPKNITTPGEVWHWQLNLKSGLKKIEDSHDGAEKMHIRERNRLNEDRVKLGLAECPMGIPSKLNSEQIERETIRRYNCGREYRWEPRNAPNCEGKWVHDLSCKRENKPGYDKDYVEKVLACTINE